MKRLVATVCIGILALAAMGFAFIALTDAPVTQQEIVKIVKQPSQIQATTP
jgi:hypothetical protein